MFALTVVAEWRVAGQRVDTECLLQDPLPLLWLPHSLPRCHKRSPSKTCHRIHCLLRALPPLSAVLCSLLLSSALYLHCVYSICACFTPFALHRCFLPQRLTLPLAMNLACGFTISLHPLLPRRIVSTTTLGEARPCRSCIATVALSLQRMAWLAVVPLCCRRCVPG